jgi:GNAT superfamily N-acetyltransferase
VADAAESRAVRTLPAAAEHAEGLEALFARADVPCHCRYWHFEGVTNGWLDRAANHLDELRAEMRAAITAGSPEMSGVVALQDGVVVGWLKLAPATAVRKLYDQRIYRRLPCFEGDRSGVFTVGCLLVDPAHRRRGVARDLVRAGVDLARSRGGRAVEAFPRRAEAMRDDEVFAGPMSVFDHLGFSVVHDFGPYPVLRLTL